MKYAVETRALSKGFGPIQAVDRLDLAVREGEIYGLLGPNGSGKTTLIRMLVGLLTPSGGSVTVLNRKMPDHQVLSQIGYMTQTPALYVDLSVSENLRFFAKVYGVKTEERIEEALDLVVLRDRRDSLISTLSGGMRQRISLACALLHRPRLLLLDEPTVGIDPALRATFWEHFRRLQAEGVTIIVSSHVMDEAERCDRLGLLRDGRLLGEGTSQELCQQAGTDTLEEAFLALAEERP